MTANAQTQPLTRREFLYYAWAASMALFTAEAGGALLWYALPRFKPGEFGGAFTIPLELIPPPDSPPIAFEMGRFWLVNIGPKSVADPLHPSGFATRQGLIALYKVCVHLGCLYQWSNQLGHFQCPCHGSQFLLDGTRVHAPANRDLDKFVLHFVDKNGNILAVTPIGDANTELTAGQAVAIPTEAASLIVDTGRRVRGRSNGGPNTAAL
jgi:cytochrome b6-f complex iron-sulfur subunit